MLGSRSVFAKTTLTGQRGEEPRGFEREGRRGGGGVVLGSLERQRRYLEETKHSRTERSLCIRVWKYLWTSGVLFFTHSVSFLFFFFFIFFFKKELSQFYAHVFSSSLCLLGCFMGGPSMCHIPCVMKYRGAISA
jgi:hypothetical protein